MDAWWHAGMMAQRHVGIQVLQETCRRPPAGDMQAWKHRGNEAWMQTCRHEGTEAYRHEGRDAGVEGRKHRGMERRTE